MASLPRGPTAAMRTHHATAAAALHAGDCAVPPSAHRRRREIVVCAERFAGLSPSEELLNEITCPLCLHLLSDPHILPCQHCFCKGCVLPWLQKASRCPVCSAQTRLMLLQPVKKLESLVGLMEFSCENDVHGCTSKVPCSALESHQRSCPHQPRIAVRLCALHCPPSKQQLKAAAADAERVDQHVDQLTTAPHCKDSWQVDIEPNMNLRDQLKRECMKRQMRRPVFINRRTGCKVRRSETPVGHGVTSNDVFYAFSVSTSGSKTPTKKQDVCSGTDTGGTRDASMGTHEQEIRVAAKRSRGPVVAGKVAYTRRKWRRKF